MLGNSPEICDKLTKEIIYGQLDIKLRQFAEDKFNELLIENKSRKAGGLREISPEIYKTRKFDNILI